MMYGRALLRVSAILFTFSYASAQGIVINEIRPVATLTASAEDIDLPWIELRNNSIDTLALSDYTLSFDSILFVPLPDIRVASFQYFIIWLGEENRREENGSIINVKLPEGTERIYLISDHFTSQVSIPLGITATESYGQYPETSDEWIFFSDTTVTPGLRNEYPGPWQKIANKTSFSPRDSSPNGVLVFDNKVWVLEGYKYISDEMHYSTSDIYSSVDAVNWELVNSNPPYDPYSVFIVFDGWMWAIEQRAYRSKDGITWEEMGATGLSLGGRGTLHDGKLYWTGGSSVYRSEDAITWQRLLN
ncbi:MAG: hypothetical protein WEB30_01625, partial [Cyclobacteriaceae bacterium]